MGEQLRAVLLGLLVTISAFGGFVGFTGTAAAADASISSIDLQGTTDRDGDEYYAAFEIEIDADTENIGTRDGDGTGGFGTPDGDDPFFKIYVNGTLVKTTAVKSATSDGFGPEYTVTVSDDELSEVIKGSQSVEVELWEEDDAWYDGENDEIDSTQGSLQVEPRSLDVPVAEKGQRGIESLGESYRTIREKPLNPDWWLEQSRERGQAVVDALKPGFDDVVMEGLTQIAGAGGLATNIVTLAEQFGNFYLQIQLDNTARLLQSTGDIYGCDEGSLCDVRQDISELQSNRRQLLDATSRSERVDLANERKDLLEDAYRSATLFNRSLRDNYRENVVTDAVEDTWLEWASVDESDYNRLKPVVELYRENLRSDYYFAQQIVQDQEEYQYRDLDTVVSGGDPAYPAPNVRSVEVSGTDDGAVARGEPVTVTLVAENRGESAAAWQSLAVSFPDADAGDIRVVDAESDFDDASEPGEYEPTIYGAGNSVGADYGLNTTTTTYPLVEAAKKDWAPGETRQVTLEVTPDSAGTFEFYVKSVAHANRWSSDPSIQEGVDNDLAHDQQNEFVYTRSFDVVVPPTADAGGPYTVTEGGSVSLDASGSSDSDGSVQATSWRVIDGSGSVSDGTYQAPDDVDSDTTATVELTVTDDDGATATDTARITVRNEIVPPTAEANGPYSVTEGGSVTLDSSGSSDSDGSVQSTSWVVVDGPGSVTGNTYTPPADVGDDTTATVELTVTDNDGATATDTAAVEIANEVVPPTADAGGPYSVTEGGSVSLDASGSGDSDGSVQSTSWRVIDGPGSVSGGTYQAPGDIDGDTTATVELTVTDDDGATATDTATVEITDEVVPPTAEANGPYSVTEGGSVALDSSGSTDPDGSVRSTSWLVISGPGSVSDGTYQAPDDVDSDTTATVELTVTDDDGATATDTAEITVSDGETAPPSKTAIEIVSPTNESVATVSGAGENVSVETVVTYHRELEGTPTVDPDRFAVEIGGASARITDLAVGDGPNASTATVTLSVTTPDLRPGFKNLTVSAQADPPCDPGEPCPAVIYTRTDTAPDAVRYTGDDGTRLSFEDGTVGEKTPPDPWYIRSGADKTGGDNTIEVTDARASHGEKSMHVASYGDLREIQIAVDVDLTDVETVRYDAYLEASNPNWGDVKLNVDDETVSNELVGGNPPEDRWYRDVDADVSGFTGEHTLYFWVRGDPNDAYFDDFRFLDGAGNRIPTDEVVVTDDGNTPPTADAGPNRSVDAGASVELDGTGSSDPDGDGLAYRWRQVGGPSAELRDAGTATPAFVAPDVDERTTLAFELTVDDGSATDTDTVRVTVAPDEPAASVTLTDQTTRGERVIVDSVAAQSGGFVVLRRDAPDGPVLGVSEFLPAGEHADVAVGLDDPLAEDARLVAVVHQDDGDGTFEFLDSDGEADRPYPAPDRSGGVRDAARVTVEGDRPDGVTVSLRPAAGSASDSVEVEETRTYELVAEGIDAGVGSYELTVNTSNASRAPVVDAADETGGSALTPVADDGSGAKLGTFNGDTADTGPVVVATVTVRGATAGEVTLRLRVESLSDESGTQYEVVATPDASLTVTDEPDAPDLVGNGNPATDPDGDGLYEDTNGDGEVTPADATVLFDAAFRNDDALADNTDLFDFNDDEEVTPADATLLFEEAF